MRRASLSGNAAVTANASNQCRWGAAARKNGAESRSGSKNHLAEQRAHNQRQRATAAGLINPGVAASGGDSAQNGWRRGKREFPTRTDSSGKAARTFAIV